MSVEIFYDKEPTEWFAMSAPFGNEFKAKALLEKNGIDTFIPLHYKMVIRRDGKRERQLVPAVSNLLFARCKKSLLQQLKNGIKYLQYKTRREGGRNYPIVIPDGQMEKFIAICESRSEKLLYFKPEELNLIKGTKVKIVGGPFDGIEGLFLKVQGARSKRVVVQLEGVAAVAVEISTDYIQVI